MRLTNNLGPDIDAENLVEAKVVRYRSFDGMEIPSILLKPHQASPANKAPALVWGARRSGRPDPQRLQRRDAIPGQSRLRNSGGEQPRQLRLWQELLYGLRPQGLGVSHCGDCVEAKTYLKSLGYVDPDKIGIIGGSYRRLHDACGADAQA